MWEGNRTQVAALQSVMLGGAKRILAGPVGLRLEKVRYSSTTATYCERTLHILLFVQSCGSRSAANLLKPSCTKALHYSSVRPLPVVNK